MLLDIILHKKDVEVVVEVDTEGVVMVEAVTAEEVDVMTTDVEIAIAMMTDAVLALVIADVIKRLDLYVYSFCRIYTQ